MSAPKPPDSDERTPPATPAAKIKSGEHRLSGVCPKCSGLGCMPSGERCDLCAGERAVPLGDRVRWLLENGRLADSSNPPPPPDKEKP